MNKPNKEPVKLRTRKLATGRTSIYLDIYDRGRRRYEYLNLYLIPERNREDKNINRETMRLAEAIQAKRVVEFQNRRYGFDPTPSADIYFFPYMDALAATKNRSNAKLWELTAHLLRKYTKKVNITFADIDADFCKGFLRFLSTQNLHRNSQILYFQKFKAALNQAERDGIIPSSPARAVQPPKKEPTDRQFLTIDELKRMASAEVKLPDGFRRAFLFSCLTGLRFSDIEKLTWGEVSENGGFTRLTFRQKKTGGLEYMDINPQASELMGERGDASDAVFDGLNSRFYFKVYFARWTKAAAVDKHITFHCGRHTFAVMMLDLGADIYTVQKLLGHSNIQTTQIYAKVLDKNKQAAAMLIPKILR